MQTAMDTTPETHTTSPSDRILFFDGVCGLCNRFVDWCLAHDQSHSIKYAPLQGETASKLLPERLTKDLKTVVLYDNGEIFTHSTAVLRIMIITGYSGFVVAPLRLIPRPLRDLGYRMVAAMRYKLFGKKETCRMPKPHERALFLP